MTVPLSAPRSWLSEFRLRVRRERALIALFDLSRQKGAGLRLAKLYAFGVFVSYALVISLTRGNGREAAIHGFVRAALVSLSWVVGGLAALGTAQSLAQQSERDALSALALQRGFAHSSLFRARTAAATLRVARLVGIPALLLVAVGVARGSSLSWALAVAPAVVVYACALGLTLAFLAQLSAELSARHPRALLAMFVLGPLLLSLANPRYPSLPRLFSGLLSQLLSVGAALS
ncbi:MAG TPA: hypothetical protein VER11_35220 [Polyangiaceae bacterium]|nr:hypothetical protein [Polyangiaceae bacterium]